MADAFTAALEELRDALVDGEHPDQAIAGVAAANGVSELALRNRGQRAYGDLATYAERTQATRTITPETARRLRLGTVREQIQRLGNVRAGTPEAARLQALVEEANDLGARYTLSDRSAPQRLRAPRTGAEFDALLVRLAKMMLAA